MLGSDCSLAVVRCDEQDKPGQADSYRTDERASPHKGALQGSRHHPDHHGETQEKKICFAEGLKKRLNKCQYLR